jgi:hypothetical protein
MANLVILLLSLIWLFHYHQICPSFHTLF